MRAIHFHETAQHFSSYASHHPFQLAAEAIVTTLMIVAVSSVVVRSGEVGPTTSTLAKGSEEASTKAPAKWVWAKRVDRGGHLYPVGP